MPLVTIESEHWRVSIAPDAGASLTACEIQLAGRWVPLMRPTPPAAVAQGNSSQMASFLLAPWSNRIRDARFPFNGRLIQLRPNTPEGYAHHGDVRKRPWQAARAAERSALFLFDSRHFADINFPFPFTCSIEYRLDGPAFASVLTLTNTGTESMPAGLGFHPYFQRALTAGEDVQLQFSARGVYRDLVPSESAGPLGAGQDFSRGRTLGAQAFDHCFAGWDGRARLHWPRSGVTVQVECDEPLGHLILYAPPAQPYFALEPVSHATNGFNLLPAGVPDTGVQILEPGQSIAASLHLVWRPAG